MIKAILSDFNFVLWLPGKDGFELNKQLVQFYKELDGSGVEIYILTSGTMAGDEKVQSQISGFIQKVIYTHQMNKWKSDPTLFADVLVDIGYDPSEVLLIDDQPSNIKAAQRAGLSAVHYKDNQQAMSEINELLEN